MMKLIDRISGPSDGVPQRSPEVRSQASRMRWRAGLVFLGLMPASAGIADQDAWYPFPVEIWNPPFDMASPRSDAQYVPLAKAARKWRICVSIPHLKDAYWLAANYGIVAEARRLGISVNLFEAGGYGNKDIQIRQINECARDKYDGIIISSVDFDGLNPLVEKLRSAKIPVVDLINGMSSTKISAKILASFEDMGAAAGSFLESLAGDRPARVAWFPGPTNAGWVKAGDKGLRKSIAGSQIEIVTTKFGDTGLQTQGELLNEALDEFSNLDYVVGTAVTAEIAVKILRKRGLAKRTRIISYYYSPGVHRAIRRGTVLGAPSDLPAIQGRIAVDQVVRILEKLDVHRHVGPKIFVVDRKTVKKFDASTSLPPKGFRPVFTED